MARSSALMLLLTQILACSNAPAVVGILSDRLFELSHGDAHLRSTSPPLIVQDETIGSELRTINLMLSSTFEIATTMPIGTGDIELHVAAAPLTEFTRPDGVTVRTADAGLRTAAAVVGEMTIDEWTATAKSGHYEATLSDGGSISGWFSVTEAMEGR